MKTDQIDNSIYDKLGAAWYEATKNPVALLRSESKEKIKFIKDVLAQSAIKDATVLDVGCGAGFVSNSLSSSGFKVTGIDLSEESLKVAQLYDQSRSCKYIYADAYSLPFSDHSFDIVVCFDFLEHVEEPYRVIKEIHRVLKPDGHFFFHTFNKNWLSWLIVIKGVEWFVPDTPKNMHILRLFINPKILLKQMTEIGFETQKVSGIRPVLNSSFWKLLFRGEIDKNFQFKQTKSLLLSYLGFAKKRN